MMTSPALYIPPETAHDRPEFQWYIILDGSHEVLSVSRPLAVLLDIKDGDPKGRSVTDVLGPLLGDRQATPAIDFRKWLEAAVAADLPGEQSLTLIIDGGTGTRTMQVDLHKVEERSWILSIGQLSARRVSEMAADVCRDHLTGAANRYCFERELDAALARLAEGLEESSTVFFLDLDRFKAVNDTLGHAIGDGLLRLVSERLRTGLRKSDILARLGGDEFGILLDGHVERERIAESARRLIDLVQRPYLLEGHVINVGASIGIAVAPSDGSSRDQLLKSADLALYHSKGAGRGVYHFFDISMEERAQERRAMEFDLRKALPLRQFELHYQPQIDVETQEVIGLEGLLRWRHPQRGLVLPGDFLSLAEEIGLAVPIGDWTLKRACKDAVAWPESVTVAVNVSALQFENAQFARSAEQALKSAGLAGSRLEIEVTEEILLRDRGNIRSTLEALRSQGVKVAMDSFGTGLASMSQLVNFPFDKIKIDRSLVGSTAGDAKGRAILRAISALGDSLGIATLAEGVETPEHLAHVRAEGCNSVQGFYYSSAVPAQELAAIFSESWNGKRHLTA